MNTNINIALKLNVHIIQYLFLIYKIYKKNNKKTTLYSDYLLFIYKLMLIIKLYRL